MSDLTAGDFVKDLVVLTVDSLEHSAAGNLVNCECPNCHKSTYLKEFQGNVLEGLTCPFCKRVFANTFTNITTNPITDYPTEKDPFREQKI